MSTLRGLGEVEEEEQAAVEEEEEFQGKWTMPALEFTAAQPEVVDWTECAVTVCAHAEAPH